MWQMLIFRDHWQGEFCVALFGAIGWALLSVMSNGEAFERPQYELVNQIFSVRLWELWFVSFGTLQLFGLRKSLLIPRLAGALGIFLGFVCVFFAIMAVSPGTLGLSTYLACVCIEGCAVIYQTARLVREGGIPKWIIKR